jgi:Domain of unknown function (DUF4304)
MAISLTAVAISKASTAAVNALGPAGFKRRSPHLLRQTGNVWHCIHFQSGKWGTATDGQFTVNLVVTWQQIFEAWTGKPLPSNPATASYPIQQRIGYCLPSQQDIWWSVDASTDTDVLAAEVANTIAQVAPKFFAPLSTTEGVLSQVRNGRSMPGLTPAQASLVRAHLENAAGNRDEAKAILMQELKSAPNTVFKSSIRSFGQRSGILDLP